jgi:IPT/TIG domain
MLSPEGEVSAPRIDGVEPARVRHGEAVALLLRGQRFVRESAVRVTQVGEVPAKTLAVTRGNVTATTIEITIPAHELQEPGQLEITVVNPDEAGGASNSRRVDVEDIEQTATDSAVTNPPLSEGEGGKRGVLGRLLGARRHGEQPGLHR